MSPGETDGAPLYMYWLPGYKNVSTHPNLLIFFQFICPCDVDRRDETSTDKCDPKIEVLDTFTCRLTASN